MSITPEKPFLKNGRTAIKKNQHAGHSDGMMIKTHTLTTTITAMSSVPFKLGISVTRDVFYFLNINHLTKSNYAKYCYS